MSDFELQRYLLASSDTVLGGDSKHLLRRSRTTTSAKQSLRDLKLALLLEEELDRREERRKRWNET